MAVDLKYSMIEKLEAEKKEALRMLSEYTPGSHISYLLVGKIIGLETCLKELKTIRLSECNANES